MSSSLTEQQYKVVKSKEKPVLIIAGPGTGKTEVIVRRYEYLVNEKKVDPKKILYVTLANSSVNDFQNKLFKYCPKLANTVGLVQSFTFYSFCREILRDDTEGEIDYTWWKIYTDEECYDIVKETLDSFHKRYFNNYELENLHNLFKDIRKLKHRDKKDNELHAILENIPKDSILKRWRLRDILRHYYDFYNILYSNEIMTFDDAALYTDKLLNKPSVLEKWTNKYEEILCDEFQDLDEIQLEILKKVSIAKRNLFCVGDPDQAIYCFRGASPDTLQKFINFFKKGDKEPYIYKLEKNFRSTPEILEIANKFINSNKQGKDNLRKELFTENKNGERPKLYVARDEEEHAQLIVNKIKEIVSKGDSCSSIAILARKKFVVNDKEEQVFLSCLEKAKIGYIDLKYKSIICEVLHIPQVRLYLHLCNIAFIDEFPIEDLQSVFNLLNIDIQLRNSLIGSWGELLRFFKKTEKDKEILDELDRNLKSLKKISGTDENLNKKCKDISKLSIFKGFYNKEQGKAILNRFLSKTGIKYMESWDTIIEDIRACLFNYDNVNLGTIHQAKGLEFKHVFIFKTDSDHYPIAKGIKQTIDKPELKEVFLKEERNVFYVGITRAKETLSFFSSSEKDNVSPFVMEIEDLLEVDQ